MSMSEMEAKVNELRELRRMADELSGEIAALEDSLKAYMTSKGSDEIHGPTFRITWKEITSSRLDSKALRVAAPELWQRFSKPTTSLVLSWHKKSPLHQSRPKHDAKSLYPSKQEGMSLL